jgi:lipooligosaccharide transport system ATP-binding protein
MDEAEQLCDRLVIMDQGKIVAEGSPRQLIDTHVAREVVELRFTDGKRDGVEGRLEGLGTRLEVLPDRILVDTDDGEAAVQAVHERGVEPDSILVRRSTLEDVFLTLTGRTLVD